MLEFPVTHVQFSQTNISIRRGSPVCYYFNYVQSSMLGNRACAMSLSLTRKRLLMYHALETYGSRLPERHSTKIMSPDDRVCFLARVIGWASGPERHFDWCNLRRLIEISWEKWFSGLVDVLAVEYHNRSIDDLSLEEPPSQ